MTSPIAIAITLIRISNERAIIAVVGNAIAVRVRIAIISQTVAIGVDLIWVVNQGTIVARIAPVV